MAIKIEQQWNDCRLKLNGVYIGCVTKENADYIKRLEETLQAIAFGTFGFDQTAIARVQNFARTVLEMEKK